MIIWHHHVVMTASRMIIRDITRSGATARSMPVTVLGPGGAAGRPAPQYPSHPGTGIGVIIMPFTVISVTVGHESRVRGTVTVSDGPARGAPSRRGRRGPCQIWNLGSLALLYSIQIQVAISCHTFAAIQPHPLYIWILQWYPAA